MASLYMFFKIIFFFIENFIASFLLFGSTIKTNSLSIILPLGICLDTFTTEGLTREIIKKMEW